MGQREVRIQADARAPGVRIPSYSLSGPSDGACQSSVSLRRRVQDSESPNERASERALGTGVTGDSSTVARDGAATKC